MLSELESVKSYWNDSSNIIFTAWNTVPVKRDQKDAEEQIWVILTFPDPQNIIYMGIKWQKK